MKSFVIASCVTLFLIEACVAIDPVVADSEESIDILVPNDEDLSLQGTDQVPVETKHWWYGHKHDWNQRRYGENYGGYGENYGRYGEGKHGKVWWGKWH